VGEVKRVVHTRYMSCYMIMCKSKEGKDLLLS